MISIIRRVKDARHLMAVIYSTFAFIAFALWGEATSWNAYVERVSSQLAETARAIGNHVDDVIEVAKQPVAALALEVEEDLKTPIGGLTLISKMRTLAASSRFVRSLAFVRADGKLVESTLAPLTAGLDLTHREYFREHQVSDSLDFRVGNPAFGSVGRDWFITISRRVNAADGSFAGVLLATVKVQHFVDFFHDYNLGEGQTFLLVAGDGTVLLRLPYDAPRPVTSFANSRFLTDRLTKPYGAGEYISPFDHERRIGGYFRSSDTHVVTTVGVPKYVMFREWMRQAIPRWIFGVLAVVAAIFLAVRWQRQSWMREKSEAATAAREAEFRAIANTSSDLIEKLDEDGVREYVSPSARDMIGLEPEQLIGRPISEGYGEEAEPEWAAALARIQAGSSTERLIFRREVESGEISWLESVITRAQDGGGMVVVTRNITSQKMLEEKLDALANMDELTRVFNKRFFSGTLKDLASAARIPGSQPFSLLLADVDRFKLFNDTYGHVPGDECLRRIAAAMRGCVRANHDVVARYGGEEFAILLPGAGPEGAAQVAEKIRETIFRLNIEHRRNTPWSRVTISIGCASFDGQAIADEDELVVLADRALYRAKNERRNTVWMHDVLGPTLISAAE